MIKPLLVHLLASIVIKKSSERINKHIASDKRTQKLI